MNPQQFWAHARALCATTRSRAGVALAAWAPVALLCIAGTACAQAQRPVLQEVQRIDMRRISPSTDAITLATLGLSPVSLAWSPDGKRIAFATYTRLPVGVVELQTQHLTTIAPPLPVEPPWPQLQALHWSAKLNRLVMVQGTDFSVFDMAQAEPRLLYTVRNRFPKVLSANGSALVPQGDDDYLVLAGHTTWRVDPSNPQIVAYSLKTGERRLAFQFHNPPVNMLGEGSPSLQIQSTKPMAAGLAANGDILVTVSASRRIDPFIKHPNGTVQSGENITWTVNLSQGQVICKYPVAQDDYNVPSGGSILAWSARPSSAGVDSSMVIHNLSGYRRDGGNVRSHQLTIHDPDYNHDQVTRYDMSTCARLPQQLERPIRGNAFVASPDGRWLFADAPYTAHPRHAPFQLWRAADGALLHNGTWHFDDAVTSAAFSQDGQYLAWGKTNEVIVYRITAPAR